MGRSYATGQKSAAQICRELQIRENLLSRREGVLKLRAAYPVNLPCDLLTLPRGASLSASLANLTASSRRDCGENTGTATGFGAPSPTPSGNSPNCS
jgi:hypothetical protein